MRTRLDSLVGAKAAKQVQISTFHALSLALCRAHAHLAGRATDFAVYTTKQQLRVVRNALNELKVVAAAKPGGGSNDAQPSALGDAQSAGGNGSAGGSSPLSLSVPVSSSCLRMIDQKKTPHRQKDEPSAIKSCASDR